MRWVVAFVVLMGCYPRYRGIRETLPTAYVPKLAAYTLAVATPAETVEVFAEQIPASGPKNRVLCTPKRTGVDYTYFCDRIPVDAEQYRGIRVEIVNPLLTPDIADAICRSGAIAREDDRGGVESAQLFSSGARRVSGDRWSCTYYTSQASRE
ncbi:MAG TPA: hypothetical protein VFQ60_01265 [Patescibacteria group bacterium]|nr:hypothetical protein [Patescibacteria group bacterium]